MMNNSKNNCSGGKNDIKQLKIEAHKVIIYEARNTDLTDWISDLKVFSFPGSKIESHMQLTKKKPDVCC